MSGQVVPLAPTIGICICRSREIESRQDGRQEKTTFYEHNGNGK
jgi:hypothetical protein